ncbi:MAG TPA: succinylglutamate desuccinylase/aspartoacylase family protein [Candidatus Udaeobacter sp.]|jgi:predicted deacylase|nr:succinylglutamate desuccinylase/aspartoacylase family protein [Candidatus Udaeobacter sp.]
MKQIPILRELKPGSTQRHLVKLPGAALANDEPRPVITVTGATAGPVLFVNAGVHGGEYPAVEAVIRLGKTLDAKKITGTVILMPVLNLPAFRTRTPFVCPVDNVNPNRVFPGDATGSYSEQMTHALINEFVVHADAYIDLHGGDIPEALVPFVICAASDAEISKKSKEIAMAFGLPYVLTISKPVQPAKGLSSYAAAADNGTPAILAEAGGVGQMQEEAVELLVNGVANVMRHLGMLHADKTPTAKSQSRRLKSQREETISTAAAKLLSKFEWLYTKSTGMWYPNVAPGDRVKEGQQIGTVGDLFGDTLEEIVSPVDGVVLFLTINPSVLENGLLMGIGAE